MIPPSDLHSTPYLTHFLGSALEDERYVVQRYRSRANGDIVPVDADGPRSRGRRRVRPAIVSLEEVEKLRPARDEIIVATGVTLRDCGCQVWAGGHSEFLSSAARRADWPFPGRPDAPPPAGRPPARLRPGQETHRCRSRTPRRDGRTTGRPQRQ